MVQGRQAYLSYQPTTSSTDAATTYDSTPDSYTLSIAGTGRELVAMFLELQDADNLSILANVTYDTLRDWMQGAWTMYEDTLQTNKLDLSDFQGYGWENIGLPRRIQSFHPRRSFCPLP
jgi:tannase